MPNGERAKNSIIQKISATNGRLLAFQLFSKENDSYNNYVLQAANMIEGYAEKQSVTKRKFWVYADQIRKKNTFCETIPNSYMLDYPEKSSTQGMIVFPPKGEFMTTDILVSSTDTLLKQIKEETSEINNAFKKAFASTGNVKDKYDASLSKYLSNQNQTKINEDYKESFAQKNLQWITKSNRVKLCYKDTMYKSLCLLVTENEVNPFKSILDELVTIKVDKKGYKKSKKTRFRNIEDVRKSLSNREIYESEISHDLIVSEYSIDNIKDIVSNDSTIIEYASTKKLRNHLYKTYKKAITNSKRYECDNRKWRKKATMSDVLKLYSMLPANSELMKNMNIKDIKNKNKLSDAELEVFLKYIEEKIEAFDGEIISKNEMSSGAMVIYRHLLDRLLRISRLQIKVGK